VYRKRITLAPASSTRIENVLLTRTSANFTSTRTPHERDFAANPTRARARVIRYAARRT
jgi:hypothetical protein